MDNYDEVACHELLQSIIPTKQQHQKRMELAASIIVLIENKFQGVKVFLYGSTPLRTYSVDSGDIDFTVLSGRETFSLDHLETFFRTEHPDHIRVQKHIKPQSPVGVPVLKCLTNDGIELDFTSNQYKSLSTLWFIEHANEDIGHDNLLKKSIMLTKLWSKKQGHIVNTHKKLLSSYAIEVMTMHLIKEFSTTLTTPLKVLREFLSYYSKFSWKKDQPLDIYDAYRNCLTKCCFFGRSKYPSFRSKELSIKDPVDPFNNIGSINKDFIIDAFKQGDKDGVHLVLNRFLKKMSKPGPPRQLCSLQTNLKEIDSSIRKVRQLYDNSCGFGVERGAGFDHSGGSKGLPCAPPRASDLVIRPRVPYVFTDVEQPGVEQFEWHVGKFRAFDPPGAAFGPPGASNLGFRPWAFKPPYVFAGPDHIGRFIVSDDGRRFPRVFEPPGSAFGPALHHPTAFLDPKNK